MSSSDTRFNIVARSLIGFTAILLLLGIARVVQLQVAPSDELVSLMGTRTTSRIELHGRGSITDRRGRLIAFTEIGQRVYVDAKLVWEEGRQAGEADPFKQMATRLCEISGFDEHEVYSQLTKTLSIDADSGEEVSNSRYVVLEHDASEAMVDAFKTRPIRGLAIQKRPIRRYPYNDLAMPILGKVGPGEKHKQLGRTGIESSRHQDLEPEHGLLQYVRDRGGSPMFVPEDGYRRGTDGKNVQLTIDMELQRKAEELISAAVEAHRAVGGWLLVIDPSNGEILAAADVFLNKEAQARGGWPASSLDLLRDQSSAMSRNRIWTDPFEPGSTFKPFFWAWATMLGKADPEEILPTPGGGYSTSGKIFRDGRRSRRIKDAYGKENQNWEISLVRSLNTAMAMIAQRTDPEEIQQMIHSFGFTSRTGIGMPGEAKGLTTSAKNWDLLYTHLSVTFGQEIAVTPLQLARGFCTFARDDGSMPLLRIVRSPGSTQFSTPSLPVLTPETVRVTKKALRLVVASNEGTGRRARSKKYSMFAKSGTPQMANTQPAKGESGYFDNRYMPNFIAASPVERPRIVVACGLQDPLKGEGANNDVNGHGYGGGYSAGRVVRSMIDFTLTYQGVPGDLERELTAMNN